MTSKSTLISSIVLLTLGFGLTTVQPVSAHDDIPREFNKVSTRVFTSYESNGEDYIQGIGSGITFKNPRTNLGFQFNTSLNYAEVLATDGYLEDFFAWQGAMKVGVFSKLSFYVEAGIDLTELFFDDLRYDDHDDYYDDYHDDIDSFVGIGAGIQAGPVKIEAFTRLREIDSRYWEADSEVFTGLQFSLNF